ncbi:MAG TPA: cytochrome c biogenesis protein CcdA [Candidatus Thermoplasmatota archaeon]|nr:cytochrome c biogenesis protein CcdA [Candidatus Thermoplasmatota archaeon]
MPVDPFLAAFAFSAGVGTFLSPCSVALVPAYVAFYAGLDAKARRGTAANALRGARVGLAAAGGALALFLAAALVVYLLRVRFALTSAALASAVGALSIAAGLALILLGLLILADRAPTFAPRLTAPRGRGPLAMAGFGVVFAIASLGCTLPLFLGVVVASFDQDAIGAAAALAAFGGGIAAPLLALSVATAVAGDAARAFVARAARIAKKAGGVVLVAAGLYVIYYYTLLAPL